MQEKIKDILEGKLKVSDLTAEELPEFVKLAGETATTELDKVSGLRKEKQRVESLVSEAQKVILNAENAKKTLEQTKSQVTQFRQEQVEKAKAKFFSSFGVSDEDKPKIEEKFAKLDSGKVDADLIFSDFVSSYAAANPQAYLDNKTRIEKMDADAKAAILSAASGHQSPPAGGDKPKFDEKTRKVAEEAGITPEAADTVLKQGMTRRLS